MLIFRMLIFGENRFDVDHTLDVEIQSLHSLGPQHSFDRVSRQGIEEEDEEDDEPEPAENLDDGPLVVVPDDVANRLDGVQEPHERRVRTTEKNKRDDFAKMSLG